jgi:hypothetical protein
MGHDVETEVAAGLSAGGFVTPRGKHAAPPGTPCYNCGTPLRGPWCYACGQSGEDFHRSAFHLVGEAVEGLTHADGRLWQTLPRLIIRPAALTRDYLAGKRASQVPPLRVFLVVLLMVFLVGEWTGSAGNTHVGVVKLDPSDRAKLQKLEVHIYRPWDAAVTDWTRTHLARAVDNPDRFIEAMGAWAHDFAFLMLPISALLLAALFVFRRRFVLFDHLIFSMHSLAFQGLLLVAMMLSGAVGLKVTGWLLLLSPLHLFFHLRGVYGLGKFGTLVRMFLLLIGTSVAFGLLMGTLVVVGLAALRA